jgi:hypothetical protein
MNKCRSVLEEPVCFPIDYSTIGSSVSSMHIIMQQTVASSHYLYISLFVMGS